MDLIPLAFVGVAIFVLGYGVEFLPIKTTPKRIIQLFILIIGITALIAVAGMPG